MAAPLPGLPETASRADGALEEPQPASGSAFQVGQKSRRTNHAVDNDCDTENNAKKKKNTRKKKLRLSRNIDNALCPCAKNLPLFLF